MIGSPVVRFQATHAQPFVALNLFPIVIVTVQVPVVPEWNIPAIAPPTSDEIAQPEAVNFAAAD